MKFFCIKDFKIQYEKLTKQNHYRNLPQELIKYFHNKSAEELLSGIRLNNCDKAPYIKKRVQGRGGYRFYFLLLINESRLYWLFVHPKTGPDGADNITDDSKKKLYKAILECIKSNDLYEVNVKGDVLEFIKQ